jgi:MFS family permease
MVGDLVEEDVGKRILTVIKAVQFVDGSGGAIGLTCIPLYMLALGISIEGFGIVFTISSLFSVLTYFIIGTHSDKLGRKRYLILGALAPPFVAFFIFLHQMLHILSFCV